MKALERLEKLSAQELASQFSRSPPGDKKKFLLIYALKKENSFYNQFDTLVHDPPLLDACDYNDNYVYPKS